MGSLSAAPLLLYLAAIFWVIGYDTIYALQDIEDDAIVGIGSTARRFGARSPAFVAACYAATVLTLAPAFWLAGAGLPAFAGLAGFAIHLGWQVRRIDVQDGAKALALFKSNRDAGLLLTFALVLDALA
jgi:4-hydroxybenzoate polyprenyltransferase